MRSGIFSSWRPVEQLVAPMHRCDQAFPGLRVHELERGSPDVLAEPVVFLSRLDGAVLLSPTNIDGDVAEVPVRESARPAKVDRDELLEIVDAIAKRGGALLDDVAEALRELSALLQKPIERVARQLLRRTPASAYVSHPCSASHALMFTTL